MRLDTLLGGRQDFCKSPVTLGVLTSPQVQNCSDAHAFGKNSFIFHLGNATTPLVLLYLHVFDLHFLAYYWSKQQALAEKVAHYTPPLLIIDQS